MKYPAQRKGAQWKLRIERNRIHHGCGSPSQALTFWSLVYMRTRWSSGFDWPYLKECNEVLAHNGPTWSCAGSRRSPPDNLVLLTRRLATDELGCRQLKLKTRGQGSDSAAQASAEQVSRRSGSALSSRDQAVPVANLFASIFFFLLHLFLALARLSFFSQSISAQYHHFIRQFLRLGPK